MQAQANGTIQKRDDTTVTYGEIFISPACYLCNTRPKTGSLDGAARFSAEVQWFHLDQKMTGSAARTPTAPKPTATYEFKDQDAVSLNVRVQRNF
jgi:hypothetical protein